MNSKPNTAYCTTGSTCSQCFDNYVKTYLSLEYAATLFDTRNFLFAEEAACEQGLKAPFPSACGSPQEAPFPPAAVVAPHCGLRNAAEYERENNLCFYSVQCKSTTPVKGSSTPPLANDSPLIPQAPRDKILQNLIVY